MCPMEDGVAASALGDTSVPNPLSPFARRHLRHLREQRELVKAGVQPLPPLRHSTGRLLDLAEMEVDVKCSDVSNGRRPKKTTLRKVSWGYTHPFAMPASTF